MCRASFASLVYYASGYETDREGEIERFEYHKADHSLGREASRSHISLPNLIAAV